MQVGILLNGLPMELFLLSPALPVFMIIIINPVQLDFPLLVPELVLPIFHSSCEGKLGIALE